MVYNAISKIKSSHYLFYLSSFVCLLSKNMLFEIFRGNQLHNIVIIAFLVLLLLFMFCILISDGKTKKKQITCLM